jgi:hypothetical protein
VPETGSLKEPDWLPVGVQFMKSVLTSISPPSGQDGRRPEAAGNGQLPVLYGWPPDLLTQTKNGFFQTGTESGKTGSKRFA